MLRSPAAAAGATVTTFVAAALLAGGKFRLSECFRGPSGAGCTYRADPFDDALARHPEQVLLPTLVLVASGVLGWVAFVAIRDRAPRATAAVAAYGVLAAGALLALGPIFVLPALLFYASLIRTARDRVLCAAALLASSLASLVTLAGLDALIGYHPAGLEVVVLGYLAYGTVVAVAVSRLARDSALPFTRAAATVFTTMGASGLAAVGVFVATFFPHGDFVNQGKAGASIVLASLAATNVALAPIALRVGLSAPGRAAIGITFAAATGSVLVLLAALAFGSLEPPRFGG